MDKYVPKCRKHNIFMKESTGPVYRIVDITAGVHKKRHFKCPKRFCGNEAYVQEAN